MSFKFEKLIVWQKAVELASDVHELTRTFAKEELFMKLFENYTSNARKF